MTLGVRISSVLLLAILSVPASALAQLESIIVHAESGTVGAQFATLTDPATGTQYVAIQSTIGGGNPTTAERVVSFTVTFPSAGVFELYARLRVGPATFNDDSFYYASSFGAKNPASDADWILANGLAAPVGYTLPNDKVTGGGLAQTGVWKWVKLSAFDGGEPSIAGFTVPEGGLTQTFQIAGREDGLDIDQIAFGRQGVFFTVFDLDNGLPGTTVPPPPPFVPSGPPIATGQAKFLGGVSSPSQNLNFTAYWNQVTPENGGKWGSVEGTRDVMNWGDLDVAYALAKNNGFPFRMHTLVWGNQQPAWIESLPPAEQREEIEEWFAAVAARYPDIDFIDVVNEPLHDPPDGPTDGNYIEALGGSGATGWDWILTSFRLARQHFPHAKLGINEFSITNNTTDMQRYIGIIQLLQAEHLIDTVGVQGHAFSTRVPAATTIANLDLLETTRLPVYVTELDIDGPTDEIQLADYQRIFPAFWEHPAVRGITLWGYRPGHWRTAQGAYIVQDNGAERPAMVWLQGYVGSTVLRPWIVTQPADTAATMGDSAIFTCAGEGSGPLSYEWLKNGVPVIGNPSASTATLTLPHVAIGDAGSYACVVSNSAGNATSLHAALAVTVPVIATTRHAPVVNGRLDGSLQMLLGESATFNSSARVLGDVLVPGTPTVRVNGTPAFDGTIDGTGSASPSSYTLTLNGGASLRHLVRRTDATELASNAPPPSPVGTRDVVLNAPGQSAGDFATVRNLTLNSNAGAIAVPPGTYGTFTTNGGSSLVLGVGGSTEPAIYNLQGLTLNSRSTVQIVGPIVLTVRAAIVLNSTMGESTHPEWLNLGIATGGVTLNSDATLFGHVVAPAGTVTVNGVLIGSVKSDRLTINSAGAVIATPSSAITRNW
jgi:endo-1,4-beta-xylanase